MDGDQVKRALDAVRSLYDGNLATYGADSRAVGWPDAAAQVLRFEKLAYVLSADTARSAPIDVADWGCGYGAMFEFLDRDARCDLASFVGYDLSNDMLTAAQERIDDKRADWVCAPTVDREVDYCFVSGTFNVRMDADDASWNEYIRSTLVDLFARSRRGMAFNLLTTYVDWRKDDLFYADPASFFTFCKSELSRRVALLHDYPLYEWTMVVLREDAP